MIKVSKRFEFERDKYQWLLHEWREGVDRKTGEPKLMKSTTYHATLKQVASCIRERELGGCVDLGGLLTALQESTDRIIDAIQKQAER